MNNREIAIKILNNFNNDKEKAIEFINSYPTSFEGFINLLVFDEKKNSLTFEFRINDIYGYDEGIFFELDSDITEKTIDEIQDSICTDFEEITVKVEDEDLIRILNNLPSMDKFSSDCKLNFNNVYEDLVPDGYIQDNEEHIDCDRELVEKYDLQLLFESLAEYVNDVVSNEIFSDIADIIENL